jgi:hypothetical protein
MAIALVGKSAIAADTGINTVTTGALATLGANFLLAAVSSRSTVPTLTDTYGNTWTGLTFTGWPTVNPSVKLFYVANPIVGAAHQITTAAGLVPCAQLFAFSGVAPVPFDVENGGTAATGTLVSAGSVTPSGVRALVFSCMTWESTAVASVSDLTLQDQTTWVFGQHMGLATAFSIQGDSALTVVPNWTVTVGSQLAATVAVFRAADAELPVGFGWGARTQVVGPRRRWVAVPSGLTPSGTVE